MRHGSNIARLDNKLNEIRSSSIFPFAWLFFLVLVGWLIYLPSPNALGYYNDDWYLMYDARVMGVDFFKTIFEIDRPLRAPLQAGLYSLFGENALGYQWTALIVRALGALVIGFSIRLISGKNSTFWLVYSFLFFIYPGFLSQPNAIDYQGHLFSVLFSTISIFTFLLAIRSESRSRSFIYLVLSTVCSWIYLGLMEYFIGIEVFKLLLGAAYLAQGKNLRQTFVVITRRIWLFMVGSLGAFGFLGWRIFIFESQRKATDISGVLTVFLANPITIVFKWLIALLSNFLNSVIGAWFVPLYRTLKTIEARDFVLDILLWLIFCAILALVVNTDRGEGESYSWRLFGAGFLGVLASIFPFVFAGREINFEDYSRYTLPVIGAAVLLVTLLVTSIKNRISQILLIALLSFSATVSHRENFRHFEQRTVSERQFWWQVYWRIPDLKTGTTLVVNYPNSAIQEDYFVWGPANFIYSDQQPEGEMLRIPINALVLNQDNLNSILAGRGQDEHIRRGNFTSAEFGDILAISQSTESSCARVINGSLIEYSEFESSSIRVIAGASDLSLIDLDSNSANMIPEIFGKEPSHDWCFYYQKADLARQIEDWQAVVYYYDQALKEGFYPSDRSEWMTLLQAHVILGNADEIKPIGQRLMGGKFLRQNACNNFLPIAKDDQTRNEIVEVFCEH